MKCPAFARLIDYLDGHLGQIDASHVAQHLKTGCSSCAATRQWYEKTVASQPP
jgi:predicted anti-sigma-YlaC factor YlaD